MARLCLIFVIVAICSPAQASVADHLPETIALKATAKAIFGGAAEGVVDPFHNAANDFIDQKITPLLNDVNTIVRTNVDNLADRADELLGAADADLKELIEIGNRHVTEQTDHIFARLNATLDNAFLHLDQTIDRVLCAVAPEGQGVLLSGIPFQKDRSCVLVERPAEAECYYKTKEATNRPTQAKVCGARFYEAASCESLASLALLDPSDKLSMSRAGDAYADAAKYAAQGRCSAETPHQRLEFVAKELEYSTRADYYYGRRARSAR